MAKKAATAKKTGKTPAKKSPKGPKAKVIEDPIQEAVNLSVSEAPIKTIISVNDLLGDADALAQMCELAAGGASVGTIEAAMGMQDKLLVTWLNQGKQDQTGALFALYQLLRRAAATARMDAERNLLVKNPMKWLESNSLTHFIEAPPETGNTPTLSAPSRPALPSPEKDGPEPKRGFLSLPDDRMDQARKIIESQGPSHPEISQG